MIKFYSPLRYPGGKNKLAKFIALICEKNNIDGHYVEPYAGGASVALHLLLNGNVKEITINDLDRSIYAFWHSILNDTDKFCRKIKKTDITIENRNKFKKIQKKKETAPLFELGFSTFFLNRTNYSGIIDGGVIGGREQKGNYKIDCRFNREELIKRIKLIAKNKKNIHLYNLDALNLIAKIQRGKSSKNTIFYFDPPYFLKGQSLYMNSYESSDHKKVSEEIRKIKNAHWIVSYDNTKEIQSLYEGVKKINYSFFHTAYKSRVGQESIFVSNITNVDITLNPVKM